MPHKSRGPAQRCEDRTHELRLQRAAQQEDHTGLQGASFSLFYFLGGGRCSDDQSWFYTVVNLPVQEFIDSAVTEASHGFGVSRGGGAIVASSGYGYGYGIFPL